MNTENKLLLTRITRIIVVSLLISLILFQNIALRESINEAHEQGYNEGYYDASSAFKYNQLDCKAMNFSRSFYKLNDEVIRDWANYSFYINTELAAKFTYHFLDRNFTMSYQWANQTLLDGLFEEWNFDIDHKWSHFHDDSFYDQCFQDPYDALIFYRRSAPNESPIYEIMYNVQLGFVLFWSGTHNNIDGSYFGLSYTLILDSASYYIDVSH